MYYDQLFKACLLLRMQKQILPYLKEMPKGTVVSEYLLFLSYFNFLMFLIFLG